MSVKLNFIDALQYENYILNHSYKAGNVLVFHEPISNYNAKVVTFGYDRRYTVSNL
jgi:hypothetical protein